MADEILSRGDSSLRHKNFLEKYFHPQTIVNPDAAVRAQFSEVDNVLAAKGQRALSDAVLEVEKKGARSAQHNQKAWDDYFARSPEEKLLNEAPPSMPAAPRLSGSKKSGESI